MKRILSFILILGLIVPGMPNCFGGFVLTKKWHGFISGIKSKWLRWIVFLVTSIMYGITIFVDAILFNSIEFWSGSNPMARSDFDANGEKREVVQKDGEKAVFTYRQYGEEMLIETYGKNGEETARLLLRRAEPGVFYAPAASGWAPLEIHEQTVGQKRVIEMTAGDRVVKKESLPLGEYYELQQRYAH